ncbi:putative two-component system response regulator [Bradyrhizobium daqingense]|uniref:Putative two-component system response regulator n=1 Tax=Bradyrhizobium daqingense TaxID=993502 RepID=A0A562L2W2_9BRAD|nr:putative two-component system response regulator [Bradyrhizobium daqingense]
MVAVADVFDALTTQRPYKEPMLLEIARDYLVENKGRQFDPACVEAFLSRRDEVIEIAGQRTIPFQRTEAPLAPTITIECAGHPTAVPAA